MLDINLKLFTLLVFSLIFDWLCQTDTQAMGKFKSWKLRLVHSLVYSGLTALLLILFSYNPLNILIIFGILLVTHFIIDERKIVMWWMVHIKKIPPWVVYGEEGKESVLWWMNIAIDQWFHILVAFSIAVIFV